jgi:hypothetical protein
MMKMIMMCSIQLVFFLMSKMMMMPMKVMSRIDVMFSHFFINSNKYGKNQYERQNRAQNRCPNEMIKYFISI